MLKIYEALKRYDQVDQLLSIKNEACAVFFIAITYTAVAFLVSRPPMPKKHLLGENMKNTKTLFALNTLSFLMLAGCVTPEEVITKDVSNAIAVCSSGYTISKEAQLELTAEITKILEGPSSIDASAGITQAIRGIAFTEEGLKNENVLKAFQTYDNCVRSDLSAYLG